MAMEEREDRRVRKRVLRDSGVRLEIWGRRWDDCMFEREEMARLGKKRSWVPRFLPLPVPGGG